MRFSIVVLLITLMLPTSGAWAEDVKESPVYLRIKQHIDSIPAIDTHDHLRPFGMLPGMEPTPQGQAITLHSIWQNSYYTWINPLSAWPASGQFSDWWQRAQYDFDDARATSFYRYMLPAFQDLYGLDYDTITPQQAEELNAKIGAHYKDSAWLEEVVTKRANIELMFIDCYWARLQFERAYQFSVPVLNVTMMVKGTHESNYENPLDSPFEYAKRKGLKLDSLDDYLQTLDAIFADAVASDAACLKSTLAYQRTLDFAQVPREVAERHFGKPWKDLKPAEQKEFEDFIFWHVAELSAKHELPFQIHTGQARIQGSNPMLLVDLIAANPKTKFILFHGGFPWVGETGVIGMKYRNVWIDSVWLPTMSYTVGKRAYQEWLEVVPSDRIMWGADSPHAESIYASTEFTRQCLAEALAEKVMRRELREEHALRIGRQIMRDNALKLFPKLRRQLWRKDFAEEAGAAGGK